MAKQEHSQQAYPVKFLTYKGDTMELVYDNSYEVYKWDEPDCVFLFSVARRGNAANIHFDCDKAGIKYVKKAIGEFCDFLFNLFDWCTMIMGILSKNSVIRAISKIDFHHVSNVGDLKVYVRLREWAV